MPYRVTIEEITVVPLKPDETYPRERKTDVLRVDLTESEFDYGGIVRAVFANVIAKSLTCGVVTTSLNFNEAEWPK